MRMAQAAAIRLGKERIRYYLLRSGGVRDRYGICVAAGKEAVLIPEISDSGKAIRQLLGSMVRGRVTPVTAQNVVEDWLSR